MLAKELEFVRYVNEFGKDKSHLNRKHNFQIIDEDVLKEIAPLKKELDRKGDNKYMIFH